MRFLCPNCKQFLTKIDNTYKCPNGHSFDISKEGYTNLIISNAKKTNNPGDNKEMCLARKDFLNAGYYKGLSDEINAIIHKKHAQNIIDVGCCEGYYTHILDKYLLYPHTIVGIDISKDSIKLASKKQDNCSYIVGSVKDIPVEDNSVDVIINNFAPHNIPEFCRVLKDDGILIKVTPAKEHLLGLKQVLFDNVILKDAEDYLQGLEVVENKVLTYNIDVTEDNIFNLLKMTPFYYKSNIENQGKLKMIKALSTLVSFRIVIYKKST